jgi:acyl-coenzyme A thioesterase PaaI-like protein
MIEEQFEIVAQFAESGIEAIKRTGLRILELRERYAKVVMPLEGNASHLGTLYAGSLFILGEFAGGIIHGVSFDYNKYVPIVKEVTVRFIRAAKSDVTMEVSLSREAAEKIQQTAASEGKSDFQMNIELKDMENEIVAVLDGTWQIRPIPESLRLQI